MRRIRRENQKMVALLLAPVNSLRPVLALLKVKLGFLHGFTIVRADLLNRNPTQLTGPLITEKHWVRSARIQLRDIRNVLVEGSPKSLRAIRSHIEWSIRDDLYAFFDLDLAHVQIDVFKFAKLQNKKEGKKEKEKKKLKSSSM